MKGFLRNSLIFLLTVALFAGSAFAVFAAWTEPSTSPPSGNIPGPLGIGITPSGTALGGVATPLFEAGASSGTDSGMYIYNSSLGVAGGIRTLAGVTQIGSQTNNRVDLTVNNGAEETLLPGGNVGIGATAPNHLLSVNGNAQLIGTSLSSVGLGFGTDDGVSGWTIGNGLIDNTHNFRIYDNTNGATRMTIDGSGHVGIGTVSPAQPLDVAGNILATGTGIFGSQVSTTVAGVTVFRDITDTSGALLSVDGNWPIRFTTNSLERMRIDGSGNVGIGTASPGQKLVVNNIGAVTTATVNNLSDLNNAYVQLNTGAAALYDKFAISAQDSGLSMGGILFGREGGIWGSYISFNVNKNQGVTNDFSEVMRVNSSGNVGIGTAGPGAKLDIFDGTLGYANIGLQSTTGTKRYITEGISGVSNNIFTIGQNADGTSPEFAINAGNVGIGTASPGYQLDVTNVNANTTVNITGSGAGTSNLAMNGVTSVSRNNSTGRMTLSTNVSDIILMPAGNVGIGTASPEVKLHIAQPGVNNAITGSFKLESTGSFTAAQRVGMGTGILWKNDTNVSIAEIAGFCDFDCTNNQGALSFYTAASAGSFLERMRISDSGKVGIGDTAPGRELSIKSSGTDTAIIDFKNSGSTVPYVGAGYDQTLDGFVIKYNYGASDYTGTALYVDRAGATTHGNVGIGTTTPNSKLDVNGTVYSETGGFKFPDGTVQTTAGGGGSTPVPTRQVLTSGTSATYTTPANVRQLKIRMVGGGGGSGGQNANVGDATAGGTGGTTSFNGVTAVGGGGGSSNTSPAANQGGIGGSGGVGASSLRISGSGGAAASMGGNSPFGGAGWSKGGGSYPGNPGAANSGSGASSAWFGNGSQSGSGGAGEYVELIINSPAASYTYTIGAGGAAGGAGTGTGPPQPGGAGGSGIVVVDEYY